MECTPSKDEPDVKSRQGAYGGTLLRGPSATCSNKRCGDCQCEIKLPFYVLMIIPSALFVNQRCRVASAAEKRGGSDSSQYALLWDSGNIRDPEICAVIDFVDLLPKDIVHVVINLALLPRFLKSFDLLTNNQINFLDNIFHFLFALASQPNKYCLRFSPEIKCSLKALFGTAGY
jgi:hypothetical protein